LKGRIFGGWQLGKITIGHGVVGREGSENALSVAEASMIITD
jgi:hypothetical protein